MHRRVRVKLTGFINLEVAEDQDRILSRFSGEMADISLKGLSFIARIRIKENCRLLLGRNMKINIPIKGMRDTAQLRGTIMGIQPYDLVASDYSIHVKLARELDSRALQGILGDYHVQISS